jgi:hypothetical protein
MSGRAASADPDAGTSRHKPKHRKHVRFQGTANLGGRVASANSVEFDPIRTLARLGSQ